jgi:hypothetical protein
MGEGGTGSSGRRDEIAEASNKTKIVSNIMPAAQGLTAAEQSQKLVLQLRLSGPSV